MRSSLVELRRYCQSPFRVNDIPPSSGDDGAILLWDVAAGRPLGALPLQRSGAVRAIAFDPAGGRLASGHEDGTVRFWDARRRRLESTLSGHTGPVYAVAFGPGGRTFASGGGDDTAALWQQDGQDRWRRLDEPLRDHTGTVASVAFTPDGHTLATGSWGPHRQDLEHRPGLVAPAGLHARQPQPHHGRVGPVRGHGPTLRAHLRAPSRRRYPPLSSGLR
jgi:WD40 repeat protein